MSDRHFDVLECRAVAEREAEQFKQLPEFIRGAIDRCPAHRDRLGRIDPAKITSPDALAAVPVLRKPELLAAQALNPPFGGFVDIDSLCGNSSGSRLFMSPGPVWEPQPPGIDPWQVARALFAAGIRRGDKVHNAFSYHMTPGGFIIDQGAIALGCLVFPAGAGNTDAQVDAAAFYKPDVYAGTPDYLKVMLDRAVEKETPLDSIKLALVSGGALFPAMREEYQQRGVKVMQCYATADLGVIAYESEHDGMVQQGMMCNENLIVEIVRPGTDTPVAAGEVGELVVTNFNTTYPLIRFGTGDLSAVIDEPSACGRTNMRIKGWMGRADQRTKIKGMFVDPKQVNELAQTNPAINKARLVVTRENDADVMTLQVETVDNSQLQADFKHDLQQNMQQLLKLKGEVVVSSGPLPNDGLVIADERDYDN